MAARCAKFISSLNLKRMTSYGFTLTEWAMCARRPRVEGAGLQDLAHQRIADRDAGAQARPLAIAGAVLAGAATPRSPLAMSPRVTDLRPCAPADAQIQGRPGILLSLASHMAPRLETTPAVEAVGRHALEIRLDMNFGAPRRIDNQHAPRLERPTAPAS